MPSIHPIKKSLGATTEVAAVLFDDLALGIEQHQGGKSLDMVLLLKGIVLLLHFRTQ